MSEYQYYEFLTIDKSLSQEDVDDLRSLSTRAHITPASFTNEYNWGDFKGDPDELMRRYFDVHVYVANWMTAILMVRVPITALPRDTVEAMAVDDLLNFRATDTHWIITWHLEESDNYDRFGIEDGRDWMVRLAPVRDELLRGDYRSLYIGWLPAVSNESLEDDDLEPFPVGGLGNLTATQQALVEFLEVDEDLVAGAGMGSSASQYNEPSQQEMDDWLNELPRDEVQALLKQLLEGQSASAERTLKNLFAVWRRASQDDKEAPPQRTIQQLRENAKLAKKIREEREEREWKELETKRQIEHNTRLKNLADDIPGAWRRIRETVERGTGRAYDEACHALVELSEAFSMFKTQTAFQETLSTFLDEHKRRRALIQRLVKAGIWRIE